MCDAMPCKLPRAGVLVMPSGIQAAHTLFAIVLSHCCLARYPCVAGCT